MTGAVEPPAALPPVPDEPWPFPCALPVDPPLAVGLPLVEWPRLSPFPWLLLPPVLLLPLPLVLLLPLLLPGVAWAEEAGGEGADALPAGGLDGAFAAAAGVGAGSVPATDALAGWAGAAVVAAA